MKIGVKLTVVVLALTIVGTLILIGATGSLAKLEIEELALANVRNIALEHGRDIQNWIEVYMDTSRAVAQIMQNFEELDAPTRRSNFDVMLRGIVKANPEILGVWTIWEPNALDAMDSLYVDTFATDASGRYIPWWVRSDEEIVVQACVEYEDADYYQYPIKTGNEMVTDPTYWDVEGRPTLMTDLVIPIKKDGRVLGTVGIDIEVSIIQAKVSAIKPYAGSVAAVFSNEGTVIAHSDPALITHAMRETEAARAGRYLEPYVQAVLKGEPYFFKSYDASTKMDMLFTSVPISIGKTVVPWSLTIGVPASIITKPVYRIFRTSILIALGMLAVIGLAAFFISASISRPINTLARMLKDISEGEGDLTKEIKTTEHNEIGSLAHYFNLTIEKIKRLVSSIKREALSLSKVGFGLAESMTETAASISEITAHIQDIRSQTQRQAASLESTNSTMKQVVEYIDLINTQIQRQADCVGQSSSAVEQMLANAHSVTQSLVKNEGNINKLAQASKVGYSGLQEVSNDIQEIAKESEGLLEINTVMENIASQTNLLSMNAAIEAAHAGESGKGFAVVADEIRKLAEDSAEQSKTISDVLAKIKMSIDKIITATSEVLTNFEVIGEEVKTVTDQETNIRQAMEEQGKGSQAILKSIGSLNDITGEVRRSAHGMLDGSQDVIKESKSLERITAEIGNGMEGMACAAEEIDGAVRKVNSISVENKKQIGLLMEEVSRFKVD
jgi:methyl-accepting chemotaxis protein